MSKVCLILFSNVLPCTTMKDLSTVFRSGRSDCADSPLYSGTAREFPHPRMTATEMFAYYARTDGPGFGFTSNEVCHIIIIMGKALNYHA